MERSHIINTVRGTATPLHGKNIDTDVREII